MSNLLRSTRMKRSTSEFGINDCAPHMMNADRQPVRTVSAKAGATVHQWGDILKPIARDSGIVVPLTVLWHASGKALRSNRRL